MTAGGAATIPIAFLTADWGLFELADLRQGDRVLIHAAAGGVDLERTVLINGAVYVGRPDILMRDRTFQSEPETGMGDAAKLSQIDVPVVIRLV